jgi:hypothetical protein
MGAGQSPEASLAGPFWLGLVGWGERAQHRREAKSTTITPSREFLRNRPTVRRGPTYVGARGPARPAGLKFSAWV